MFHDAFKPMREDEAQIFLTQAGPLMQGMPFGDKQPRVLHRTLPFYKQCDLVEVLNQNEHPPVMRAFVRKKGEALPVALDWTNEPVYALNSSVPLALTSETVIPYVKFFFTYIKGKHGRFLIVDTPDDINWKDEPPPAGRKALGKMIEPLGIRKAAADGSFQLAASLIFKDSLFAATITVAPDGQVTLSDEELVVEDIPIRDDTLGL